MRTLLDIRSGIAEVVVTSPLRGASLTSLPFLVMLSLSWIWQPASPYGRLIVTGVLGALIALVCCLGRRRRRSFAIRATSELRWDPGLEPGDPYRVVLGEGSRTTPLLEHEDPAVVLSDLRKLLAETGARASYPAELEPLLAPQLRERRPLTFRMSTRVVGSPWLTQRRVAAATLGGALFVLVVFLISARAEAGLSTLSALLPLASILVVTMIGWAIAVARVEASIGPDGLHVHRVVFGARRRQLALDSGTILGVWALGHPGYPERDLLVETTSGVCAVPLAGDAARRLAAHARSAAPALDGRPRQRGGEELEASHAAP